MTWRFAAASCRAANRAAAAVTLLGLVIWVDGAMAAQLTAARIWPAPEYTRITLEAPASIDYRLSTLHDPARVVLELADVDLNPALESLPARVAASDPFIASIRLGRDKPGVIRLVFALKSDVQPQAFVLKPVGDYGFRLVLDLFPVGAPDPLMAMLQRNDRDPGSAATTAVQNHTHGPTIDQVESMGWGPSLPGIPTGKPVAELSAGAATASQQKSLAIGTDPRRGGAATLVAIDAGHGGEDPGARGAKGTLEKDVTLAIARQLKALVDDQPGMRAILIRDGDYFVPLGQRVNKARALGADVFVSIHADAFDKPHARGSSVFALSERGATSAAARWLAKKENEADLIGGANIDVADPTLKQVLLDLSQTATINDSLRLGRAVLGRIGEVNTLHKSQVEQAGFAVLKAPDIPSILVETAFISNRQEEARLNDGAYQGELAQAILAGMVRYLGGNARQAPGTDTPAPRSTAAAARSVPAAIAAGARIVPVSSRHPGTAPAPSPARQTKVTSGKRETPVTYMLHCPPDRKTRTATGSHNCPRPPPQRARLALRTQ